MTVKISSLSSGNLKDLGNSDPIERTDRASNAFSTEPANINQDDIVSLTGTAAQMLQLESKISKMSVIDAQLVQEVQHKLAKGSFRVNPDSTASKLLTMETSLP
jgi:flagellar biosynthesis anti-sigma factor FlgM